MMIQHNMTKSGNWADADIAKLIDKTGFVGFDESSRQSWEDLYSHACECYPGQDWRLIDFGVVMGEQYA